MRHFDNNFLDRLTKAAKNNPRQRQHYNLHSSHSEPSQKLFNAIEPDSYIVPHRHTSDPKSEVFFVLRGCFMLFKFTNHGEIEDVWSLSTHNTKSLIGCEIPFDCWHTLVSVQTGSVIFEVKNGPFEPAHPKEQAPWAPKEDSLRAQSYLTHIKSVGREFIGKSDVTK